MDKLVNLLDFEADKSLQGDLKKIIRILRNKFGYNLQALILYGSWIKGNAREDSDIDLLVIFKSKRKDLIRKIYTLTGKMGLERDVSLVSASVKEFEKETIPLYTAVKREGQIIYGKVDLTFNPEPPQTKYRDFFTRSANFEGEKIKTAEHLMEKGISSGIEFCCIASKHAIQAGLAMKGIGFSSKFSELANWAEKYFGKELADVFRTIFGLYIKAEYNLQDLNKQENLLSIRNAKRILREIYSRRQ